MSQQMREDREDDNVLRLPNAEEEAVERERADVAAAQVRRQVQLLQGYVDLMDGLSPQQIIRILKVIALKISELTEGLRPFLEESSAPNGRKLSDYREARRRNQELMSDFRVLVKRLRLQLEQAQENMPPRPMSVRSKIP